MQIYARLVLYLEWTGREDDKCHEFGMTNGGGWIMRMPCRINCLPVLWVQPRWTKPSRLLAAKEGAVLGGQRMG